MVETIHAQAHMRECTGGESHTRGLEVPPENLWDIGGKWCSLKPFKLLEDRLNFGVTLTQGHHMGCLTYVLWGQGRHCMVPTFGQQLQPLNWCFVRNCEWQFNCSYNYNKLQVVSSVTSFREFHSYSPADQGGPWTMPPKRPTNCFVLQDTAFRTNLATPQVVQIPKSLHLQSLGIDMQ